MVKTTAKHYERMAAQSVPVPFKDSISVTSLETRSRIHAMAAGTVHLWASMIIVEAGGVVAEMGLDDVDRIFVDGRKVYEAFTCDACKCRVDLGSLGKHALRCPARFSSRTIEP